MRRSVLSGARLLLTFVAVMPAMGELNNLEVWKTTYELCQGWFQRLEEGSVRDETVVEITSVMRRLTLMVGFY